MMYEKFQRIMMTTVPGLLKSEQRSPIDDDLHRWNWLDTFDSIEYTPNFFLYTSKAVKQDAL